MSDRHTPSPMHTIESPHSSGDFFVSQAKKPFTKQRSVVITGGPSTGKTTVIRHLKKHRPDLEYIDEAATMVLSSGFPTPGPKRPWTQTWQNGLQMAVAGMQLGLETSTREQAGGAIIQDRGLLDGASYLEGGVDEFEELTGMERRNIFKRYHAVIYLGWLTARDYGNSSNPQRFEDEHRAQMLSDKVRDCWEGHPEIIEITQQQQRAAIVEQLLPKLIGETA